MTNMAKTKEIKTISIIETETILFVVIAACVSFYFIWRNNQNNLPNFNIVSPSVQTTPIPSPTIAPQNTVNSQVSPDGTKKVTVTTMHNNNGTLTYTASAEDSSGENQQQIYTTTLDATETITIPFNTWSPDNRYLFLVKNGKDAMVFNAFGTPFANGETFLDVTDAFTKRNTGNMLAAVTGWASPTLIIINSTTSSNNKGPSYWFEVPSKAIIQLSTEF